MLTIVVILGLLMAGKAEAGLIDLCNGLIYDDVLDITWTQNANLCVALNNCPSNADGSMHWDVANEWTANLVYQGSLTGGWHRCRLRVDCQRVQPA